MPAQPCPFVQMTDYQMMSGKSAVALYDCSLNRDHEYAHVSGLRPVFITEETDRSRINEWVDSTLCQPNPA